MKLESSVPEKSLTQNSRSDGPCCGGSGESHCCEELGSNEPWWKIQQQPIIAGLCNPILRTFLSLELSDTKQPKINQPCLTKLKLNGSDVPNCTVTIKEQILGILSSIVWSVVKLLGQNNFAKFGDTVPLSAYAFRRYTCTSITSQRIALDDETDLTNCTYDRFRGTPSMPCRPD